MGRAEVKTTGLDTNDCWSIEIMHWKSRDERKWRSSPIGLVLYMGTESEKKSQMRKCGMIWADLPLTSKGGGWWLGTIITIIKSYLNLAVSYQVYLAVGYQVYLAVSYSVYLLVSYQAYLVVNYQVYLVVSYQVYLAVSYQVYL